MSQNVNISELIIKAQEYELLDFYRQTKESFDSIHMFGIVLGTSLIAIVIFLILISIYSKISHIIKGESQSFNMSFMTFSLMLFANGFISFYTSGYIIDKIYEKDQKEYTRIELNKVDNYYENLRKNASFVQRDQLRFTSNEIGSYVNVSINNFENTIIKAKEAVKFKVPWNNTVKFIEENNEKEEVKLKIEIKQ